MSEADGQFAELDAEMADKDQSTLVSIRDVWTAIGADQITLPFDNILAECAELAMQGKSDAEIGRLLGISESDVFQHFEDAKWLFAVSTRMALFILRPEIRNRGPLAMSGVIEEILLGATPDMRSRFVKLIVTQAAAGHTHAIDMLKALTTTGHSIESFLDNYDELAKPDREQPKRYEVPPTPRDKRFPIDRNDPRLRALDDYTKRNPGKPISEYLLSLFANDSELSLGPLDTNARDAATAVPPLPERAPKGWPLWPSAKISERETPPEFIVRIYGNWMDAGAISKPDIRRLDPKLYRAFDNWLGRGHTTDELPEGFNLPTLQEMNSSWVKRVQEGKQPMPTDSKELARFAMALRYREQNETASAAPPLPNRAPERWPVDASKRTESPPEFALRVYRPWMEANAISRQDLKKLDPALFASLDYWIKNNSRKDSPTPLPEGFSLLTRSDVADAWVAKVREGGEPMPTDPAELARLAMAMKRRPTEK